MRHHDRRKRCDRGRQRGYARRTGERYRCRKSSTHDAKGGSAMMKVPFVDLYQQHQEVEAELVEVFQRVLRKSSFILGPEVQTFEKSFASYIGSAECIAVNNGTTALQLVLLGLGIGPEQEVITVANTFIATAE